MKKNIIFTILCFFIVSCTGIKNMFSFFPDRKFILTGEKLPGFISERKIRTSDGETVNALYFSGKTKRRNLIIYFHGNAGNAYHRVDDAVNLYKMNCDVLLIDYRGYGRSTGEATETGVYTDSEASLEYSVKELHYSRESIFIFGRSIGTAVAVNLGQNRKFAGMILVSPLTSAREFVKSKSMWLFQPVVGDSFNSIGKINNIHSPILFIHGTDDEVVHYALGLRLYNSFNGPKEFVRIEGGDHNTLQKRYSSLYWNSIRIFLKKYSTNPEGV